MPRHCPLIDPIHRSQRNIWLKTPESAYLRPILEILVEQGGSGDANMVLDLLYAKLAPVLNDSHSIRSCLHPL